MRPLPPVSLNDKRFAGWRRKITRERLEKFAALRRRGLQSGDPAFRRAYLHLFVNTVAVSDCEIKISGSTLALAKGAEGEEVDFVAERVPSFIQEWRPLRDSNPCYRRERAMS